jgi:hypothetical protein
MSEIDDKIYDNYLLFVDNLNYIYNRSLFNNNLKKLIYHAYILILLVY